ncbi:hypothetical protein NQ317_014832 [Molorchus minor]|uniref:Uncharacterized protein n=1 Tax=Molorchus minor TaxID=1323400 RepID=A0ABQ9JV16_9CUCU|nr:hypothetical protein NQ317_014832 [Molorchus minor]
MAHVYARPHHMLQTEEEVLDIVEDDPSTSTGEIARQKHLRETSFNQNQTFCVPSGPYAFQLFMCSFHQMLPISFAAPGFEWDGTVAQFPIFTWHQAGRIRTVLSFEARNFMMSRVNFFFVTVFFVIVYAIFAAEIASNFYKEESCKGFCVLENECPGPVDKASRNLCPNQKKDGAVCCKNFPQEDANCFQTHNDCMDERNCPTNLNIGRKGCSNGNTCCVLV